MLALLRDAEQALRLEVGLERGDLLGVRPVPLKYSIVFSSTGKKPIVAPYSGAMLAMVARSGSASVAVPSPKNSTNLPTTFALRSISVTRQHEVGRGHAFAQLAVQVHADHVRRQEVHRLAEHAGLGLDAAHAPADDADAVDHRRVAVGADQRVGVVDAVCFWCTPRARYSRLTWCTMPMPGGTTLKVSKACMPHFMNS